MVTLFRVKAVVQYRRGSSANSGKLNIGDVEIPRQFAHTGLFYWEKVELDKCTSKEKASACLQEQPRIKRVEKGSSSNFYVNNEAYRDFLRNQLNVVSIDTSSAAIAMVCESENKPFIAMRSITDYAGGSPDGNDITVMRNLWPQHARKAITQIFTNFGSIDSNIRSVA